MSVRISLARLPLENLRRRPFRTASLITVVAILSVAFFGGSMLAMNLNKGLTSMEERLGADLMVVPQATESKAEALLTDLQVDDLAHSYPRELSGGEMRRVSIARALMNQPKLLIADEPTGDLDAESTLIVMRLLRSLVDRGTSVLMVTHDADALPYADRILTLDAGRLAEKTA